MKYVSLGSNEKVPALGMGTWQIGDHPASRKEEIRCLQQGIDLGMGLIDTAEMYGEGAAEKLVGEAIAGRRERVFLVSKVYPHHATRSGTIAACERSLARLGTDYLDLYLLHWRSTVPFQETVEAFLRLKADGKIREWGVSNLDADEMEELYSTPGGEGVATNQVLYNLSRRGAEWDLLPWCSRHEIPLMAYSPIEQARLLRDPRLKTLAQEINQSPAQLVLAWVLARGNVIAIPKAAKRAHLEENYGALACALDQPLLGRLDAIFPPPHRKAPLEMI